MRALRSLTASLVLCALLVGVPVALAGTIGNPARALPDLVAGDVTDAALIASLAAVAWLAWAQFAFATVVETVSVVRRTPVPRRLPGVLGGQQQLARALVTAAFLLGPLSLGVAPPAAYAAALPTPPASTLPVAALPGPSPAAEVAAGDTGPSAAPASPATAPVLSVVVQAGDGPRTYWDLAERHLGSGARWGEIWQLNEGREQPGGAVMTSPHRLLPGWTVLLPAAGAADAATPQTSTPSDPAPDREVTVRPGDTLSEIAAGGASPTGNAPGTPTPGGLSRTAPGSPTRT